GRQSEGRAPSPPAAATPHGATWLPQCRPHPPPQLHQATRLLCCRWPAPRLSRRCILQPPRPPPSRGARSRLGLVVRPPPNPSATARHRRILVPVSPTRRLQAPNLQSITPFSCGQGGHKRVSHCWVSRDLVEIRSDPQETPRFLL
ncbi:hypothetical protein BRADI_1g18632v3, partial [Brachypodium distachyon]